MKSYVFHLYFSQSQNILQLNLNACPQGEEKIKVLKNTSSTFYLLCRTVFTAIHNNFVDVF